MSSLSPAQFTSPYTDEDWAAAGRSGSINWNDYQQVEIDPEHVKPGDRVGPKRRINGMTSTGNGYVIHSVNVLGSRAPELHVFSPGQKTTVWRKGE